MTLLLSIHPRPIRCGASKMTLVYSHTQSSGAGGPSVCQNPKERSASERPDSWFLKIVCCIFAYSRTRHSDVCLVYLRKFLTPRIAFEVTRKFNDCPEPGFGFWECSRKDLGINHYPQTYEFLIKALCRSGLHNLAGRVFDCMRKDGHLIDISLSGFLVSSLVEAGKISIAKQMLSEVNGLGIKFSTHMCNSLLSILVNKNQVDEAIDLFRNELLLYSCPDAWTFNILIRGLCKKREMDRAFELFHDIGSFSCSPDIITYNTLIGGLCRVNEIDRAHLLFREVKSSAKVSPNLTTYNSFVSGLCKSGRMDEALALLKEMVASGIQPCTFTCNILIDGFGKAGNIGKARAIYDMMTASPNSSVDVVTFTSLIDGYCRAGLVNEGLKCWHAMIARNISPNAYTFAVVINALARDNRLDDALEFLRRLRLTKIVPKPFMYNPVIDGLCKAGNVDKANSLVAEMEEKGCWPDKLTFTILIIGHCMKGRMNEAMNIHKKMLQAGCAPDSIAVNSFVSCLLKAGMAKEAFLVGKAAIEDPNLAMPLSKRAVPMRGNEDCVMAN